MIATQIPQWHILDPPWLRYGIPSPIWMRNIDIIKKLVDAQKLTPIADHQLPMPMMEEEMVTRALKPQPFPGGLKIAHVHYNGHVYALNRQQWQTFSAQVLDGLKKDLESAKTVSFTQLVGLSEAVEAL